MSFWRDLESDDDLNNRIWQESPEAQNQIQTVENARQSGVGAQQAMLLPDRALPWVPDLIGENSNSADGVLVVGSAYAPFVTGATGRPCTLGLSDYSSAKTWQEFQSAFLKSVVEHDSNYYGPLTVLARATPVPSSVSHLAFLDLCRASFVRRVADRFQGGDAVVGAHCELYERYVEHPAARDWLWQRVARSAAERLVALGTIAEHGLLRLFASQGCKIRVGKEARAIGQKDGGAWVRRYASSQCKLTHWTSVGAWWEIEGNVDGELRVWRLLPIRHPSRALGGYEREVQVLTLMREQ